MNDARTQTFFERIVRLPQAYAQPSSAEAQSHHDAALALYQESVPFLESLPLKAGTKVLDVGAGYGHHCAWFAQQGLQAVGVSAHITPELQRHGREHGYQYWKGDMHELHFPDQWFDLIWSHHSLEHSYSPLTALREQYRVLKKGGCLAVTVPPHKFEIVSGHFHTGWSVGQLLYLLGTAGYELRGGTFLEEGYNVRALVRRPEVDFDPVGASWLFRLKERLPPALLPHLQAQPTSLGQWNFPGRISFLNDHKCVLWGES